MAVTTDVMDQNPVGGFEAAALGLPVPGGATEAVKEQDRLAGAVIFVVEGNVGQIELRHGGISPESTLSISPTQLAIHRQKEVAPPPVAAAAEFQVSTAAHQPVGRLAQDPVRQPDLDRLDAPPVPAVDAGR